MATSSLGDGADRELLDAEGPDSSGDEGALEKA
jgi:hypothetical protein